MYFTRPKNVLHTLPECTSYAPRMYFTRPKNVLHTPQKRTSCAPRMYFGRPKNVLHMPQESTSHTPRMHIAHSQNVHYAVQERVSHSPNTSSNSLLQKVKSGMGSPEYNVSMVGMHLPKLRWVYCPGHAGMMGNDRADRLAGKATLTSVSLLGRSEVLSSLKHYLWAQT